jgi:hypothetical protein
MKAKSLFLISALLTMSLLPSPATQATTRTAHESAADPGAPLPDLIVYWTGIDDPSSGKFDIRIKNQGTAAAGESYVILKIYHVATAGAKPVEKSYHAKVPAIAAGQYRDVVIETHLNTLLDKSCNIADGTKVVTESNEANNRSCGDVDS